MFPQEMYFGILRLSSDKKHMSLWHKLGEKLSQCFRPYLCLLMSLMGATIPMGAQDRCVALIQNGLYNTYRTISGNSNISQAQSQFCADYNSYKQTGIQGNLGVSYGLFSGSAGFNQSQVEAVGQAVCTANFTASSANAMLNNFASVVDQGSIAAFSACVTAANKGLIYELTPSPADPNTVTISAHYQQVGARVTQRVNSISIAQDASASNNQSVECTGELYTRSVSGVTLDSNVLSMTCTRSGSNLGFSYYGRRVYAAPVRIVANTNVGAIITDLGLLPIEPAALPTALVPVGTVVAFGGERESAGWMHCDGRPLSRTAYSFLFAAIGTSHGAGDGATTFNLPDYRGRFLRGVSTDADNRDPDRNSRTAAQTGGNSGNKVGSLQDSAFAKHDHEGGDHRHKIGIQNGAAAGFGQIVVAIEGQPADGHNGVPDGQPFHTSTTSSEKIVKPQGASETRPSNANVHYLIKVTP